ncbi:hypothetical protein [Paenibacillus barengoltzii]|jgi:hypothetical protein|uniref:hypothetical protein n=1 Tax=Paenibacillus barengoltzii TaxID=343517 RepID=UPI00111BEAE5|nr:hypothetical protein [Paenibacillus barengoltzii]
MRFKRIAAMVLTGVISLTGTTFASASPELTTSESVSQSIQADGITVTQVRSYDVFYYKWYEDTPEKIWYNTGTAAGWLYRTDGYQSNGRWYIQYTGTIYVYD